MAARPRAATTTDAFNDDELTKMALEIMNDYQNLTIQKDTNPSDSYLYKVVVNEENITDSATIHQSRFMSSSHYHSDDDDDGMVYISYPTEQQFKPRLNPQSVTIISDLSNDSLNDILPPLPSNSSKYSKSNQSNVSSTKSSSKNKKKQPLWINIEGNKKRGVKRWSKRNIKKKVTSYTPTPIVPGRDMNIITDNTNHGTFNLMDYKNKSQRIKHTKKREKTRKKKRDKNTNKQKRKIHRHRKYRSDELHRINTKHSNSNTNNINTQNIPSQPLPYFIKRGPSFKDNRLFHKNNDNIHNERRSNLNDIPFIDDIDYDNNKREESVKTHSNDPFDILFNNDSFNDDNNNNNNNNIPFRLYPMSTPVLSTMNTKDYGDNNNPFSPKSVRTDIIKEYSNNNKSRKSKKRKKKKKAKMNGRPQEKSKKNKKRRDKTKKRAYSTAIWKK